MPIDEKSLQQLRRNDAKLTSLVLDYQIDDDNTLLLAEALSQNTTLKELNIEAGKLGPGGIQVIVEAIKQHKALSDLDVGINEEIGDEGSKFIAELLSVSSNLSHLNLQTCGIGTEGIKAIATALQQNNTLRILNLNFNEIDDEGLKYLCDGLSQNTTLTHLYLEGQEITLTGVKHIIEMLHHNNHAISFIDIGNNALELDPNAASDPEVEKEMYDLLKRNIKLARKFIRAAREDDVTGLQKLIGQGVSPVAMGDIRDADRRHWKTPLHLAIDKGNVSAVRYLVTFPIALQAYVSSKIGAPLDYAKSLSRKQRKKIKYHEIIKLLTPLAELNPEDIKNEFHDAICDGNLTRVNQLLEFGVDINACVDDQGSTPLGLAAEKNKRTIVRRLLQEDVVDVNAPGLDNMTPLEHAAYWGYAEIVKDLLDDSRVEINWCQEDTGMTALHWAAQSDSLIANSDLCAVINVLLRDSRIDPFIVNDDNETIWHCAIAYKSEYPKRFDILLRIHGCDKIINNTENDILQHVRCSQISTKVQAIRHIKKFLDKLPEDSPLIPVRDKCRETESIALVMGAQLNCYVESEQEDPTEFLQIILRELEARLPEGRTTKRRRTADRSPSGLFSTRREEASEAEEVKQDDLVRQSRIR